MVNVKPKFLYLRVIAITAIVFFIFKRIEHDWEKIKNFSMHIDFMWLALSFIGLFLAYLFYAIVWTKMSNKFQDRLTLPQGIKIWFFSQPAKYVPGKGFILVSRALLAKKYGIDNETTFACGIVEFTAQALGGFLMVFASMPFIAVFSNFFNGLKWLFVFALLGFVVIHPKIFSFLINKLLKVLKRKQISLNMTYADMAGYMASYASIHFMAGISFYIFARAFYPVPLNFIFLFATAFTASYFIGLFSFLTPAGLGVREGLLLVFLNNVLPPGIIVQIVLLSRLWTVGLELLVSGIIFAMDKICEG